MDLSVSTFKYQYRNRLYRNFECIDSSIIILLGDRSFDSYRLSEITEKVIVLDLSVTVINVFVIAPTYAYFQYTFDCHTIPSYVCCIYCIYLFIYRCGQFHRFNYLRGAGCGDGVPICRSAILYCLKHDQFDQRKMVVGVK